MILKISQAFPGDLLEHTYSDPNDPRQLLARSEVDRRGNYFELLERKLQKSASYTLVGVVKQCLENIPNKRPTAEQLVTVLEGLKGDTEGPCGELTVVNAVSQVRTAKVLYEKRSERQSERVEIEYLQLQLEV